MNIKIKKYEIYDENIPKELSGYRIALFSDTHDSNYGTNAQLIVDKIDEINPDIVLFAGDGNCTKHNCEDPLFGHDYFDDTFFNVAKKYETYYVPGNHEHRWKALCDRLGSSEFDDAIERLKGYGVHYLVNESVLIADGKINLACLDLPKSFYEHDYEKLDVNKINNFVGKSRNDIYNILLSHTPIFFKEYAEWGADLTLSGHMHGGIIRLPIIGGVLSPYRSLFPKYDYGLYKINGSKLIVSSGAGEHNVRFSYIDPYEVVSIILKSKE